MTVPVPLLPMPTLCPLTACLPASLLPTGPVLDPLLLGPCHILYCAFWIAALVPGSQQWQWLQRSNSSCAPSQTRAKGIGDRAQDKQQGVEGAEIMACPVHPPSSTICPLPLYKPCSPWGCGSSAWASVSSLRPKLELSLLGRYSNLR